MTGVTRATYICIYPTVVVGNSDWGGGGGGVIKLDCHTGNFRGLEAEKKQKTLAWWGKGEEVGGYFLEQYIPYAYRALISTFYTHLS